MTTATQTLPLTLHPLLRFLKTPKGLLLAMLTVMTLIALSDQPFDDAAPAVLSAMAVCAVLDVAIIWVLRSEWEFPSGALLTGLIVGVILRPQEPSLVVVAVAAIAIISKHVLRTRWSNIFNPAALALVASSFLFSTGQSWWGSMPTFGPLGLILLFGAGLFMADRINKLPLVVFFLGAYFALFTFASFIGRPANVAEVFRTPDLQATLFFAFFMVDDPPTCPIRYEDQIPFAVIVAVASFLIFVVYGAVYFLPAGLLVANAWESGRRQFGPAFKRLLESTLG
jgi:Na+-translocating ferredoxin:NAD+ oxidoreductase RnfD subunit